MGSSTSPQVRARRLPKLSKRTTPQDNQTIAVSKPTITLLYPERFPVQSQVPVFRVFWLLVVAFSPWRAAAGAGGLPDRRNLNCAASSASHQRPRAVCLLAGIEAAGGTGATRAGRRGAPPNPGHDRAAKARKSMLSFRRKLIARIRRRRARCRGGDRVSGKDRGMRRPSCARS